MSKRSRRKAKVQKQYEKIHWEAKWVLVIIVVALNCLQSIYPDFRLELSILKDCIWILCLNFIGYEIERLRKFPRITHKKT